MFKTLISIMRKKIGNSEINQSSEWNYNILMNEKYFTTFLGLNTISVILGILGNVFCA